MKTLILGPTFTLDAPDPPDAIADRLGARTSDDGFPFAAQRNGRHFQFAVRRGERHRWSPWLTLEVCAPDEGAGALVRGRFNPSPAIWTGYVLASLALLTTAFGAAMWGVAELMMRKPPHALWVIPACLAVLAVMWGISAAGQRLAEGEMDAMRAAVSHALGATRSE